ncbi:MAG: glycosyl hydrolase, partial [Bacteroidota bacterium]
ASWEQIHYVSDTTGAIDMVMNPNNPREIYAAFWRAERKPHTLIDGGEDGGIWKSMDGGDTWKKLGGGLPGGLIGKIGLAISPVKTNRIWAIIQTAEEKDGGLYRSDNSGKSWSRICRDHQLRQRGWYYSHITAHPTDENTIYSNNVRFHKSIDGGKTFPESIWVPHGDNHGVWINPNNPNIMIQCNDGGATVTLNGGKSWSTQLNQPTSEFYRVTVDNQFPYRLYAGQQDNSTISVPSRYVPGITATQNWFSVGGSECGDVGVHPENPDIVWAGSYSGELTIMNRATGQVRQVTAYPHYTEGTRQQDLKYRWQWNFPIVVSRHNPQVVYHTSNYVHKTSNDGQSWEKISPDLTNKLAEQMDIPGGPIQHDATGVEVYSSIFAFEECMVDAQTLWAGSDDGKVHISRDGGASWQDITPEDMPTEGTVNKIELSSHDPARALMAVYNYRNDDFTPYVFLTNDFGKNWELITDGKNGIPKNHFVRAIAEDPIKKGLFYAGTEYGIYYSIDEGKSWNSLQLNLPHVPITDMEVHQGDLVLSTQGRAFWILDNIEVLQQWDEEKVADKHFFVPAPAYRTNVGGYRANFFVYLNEAPEKDGDIKLEIITSEGNTIRTYSKKAQKGLDKIRLKKGLNQFSWDQRHDGPDLVGNLVTMVIRNPSPGPRAVPDQYTAKLTIGEWSSEQKIDLKLDPRWDDVGLLDYAAQLQTGLEIRDMITESHHRIMNLRALKKQINGTVELLAKRKGNEQLEAQAKVTVKALDQVEDLIIQNKSEASQDNINYPRVFSNHIGRLYGVVVNAHHRPTGGALERWEDIKKEYDGIVKAYKAAMQHEVAAYQALLTDVDRLIVPMEIRE